MYASFLTTSQALHLDVFDRPGSPRGTVKNAHLLRYACRSGLGKRGHVIFPEGKVRVPFFLRPAQRNLRPNGKRSILHRGWNPDAPWVMVALVLLALLPGVAGADPVVSVADVPNDDGTALAISWESAFGQGDSVTISRAVYPDTLYTAVAEVDAAAGRHVDSDLSRHGTYVYRLTFPDGTTLVSDPVSPSAAFINSDRLIMLIILGLFFIFVLIYIRLAAGGRDFFVRKITGLSAIEEAIGRATEMGRPVLYVPGIDDLDNIQTIASMVILNDVARIAATYETPIIVPVCRPFVVAVAEEAVKQGFLNAGRPELYNPDNVRYLSDEQFAFTAGVNGIMLREKTAANLYLGSFFAESLILAETGFSTGAIQVAGTANIHQLPFFVAACDFTLIGEELYAASAYLSREPKLLGTLKASDLAKVIIICLLIAGCITEALGITAFAEWFRAR
jgi:hypothetical protein